MNKKVFLSKEELQNLYIDQNKSAYTISVLYNCATRTICKYLKKYNIKTKIGARSRIKIDRDKLYQLYEIEKKSAIQIAKIYNCNEETIRNRLKQYNIEIRNLIKINKNDLYRMYILEKKTIKEICCFYSCSNTTLYYNLDNFNIKRKTKFKGLISKDDLIKLYINNYKSINDIRLIYKCSNKQIKNYLIKYNISIRKNNEKPLPDIIGKKFGKLLVIKLHNKKNNRWFWYCKCDCGQSKIVDYGGLKYGHTKSCGCLLSQNGDRFKTGYKDITGNHFCQIKRSARDRGIEFNISIEDIWDKWMQQKGICYLTGRQLILKNVAKTFSQKTASLDRIDSLKGYTKDNVRWVHKDINRIKWHLTDKDFIKLCKEVTIFNLKNKE